MTGIFTTKDLCGRLSIYTAEALALKIASVCFWRDSVCFTLLQDTAELEQNVVGVITDLWSVDLRAEPLLAADGTFLEHGDTQVLFALRMSAAHHGLRIPLLCAVVTHCQDLDLAVVLLETQAVHCCGATMQTNHIGLHRDVSCC